MSDDYVYVKGRYAPLYTPPSAGMTQAELDKVNTAVTLFYRKYHREHEACPCCGSTHIGSTLLAFVLTVGKEDEYRDANSCHCKCGWRGIIHDLVPVKGE